MFLIIKILSKIKIHFFFYIVMFICLITGNFRDFIVFSLIIFVHELGHVFGGLIFKYDIISILVLPIGGLTKFNNGINVSLLSTFVVTVMGPLFQIIFFYLYDYFFYVSDFVFFYNFILLGFNLLPIYPLDGSKLLSVLLCLFFPFKYSHLLVVYISFLCILCLFLFISFDLVIYLILFFLLVKCILELINHNYLFNVFLLERYMNNFKFRKCKIVRSVDGMFLNKKHLFLIDNTYISEDTFLKKMFDKSTKL